MASEPRISFVIDDEDEQEELVEETEEKEASEKKEAPAKAAPEKPAADPFKIGTPACGFLGAVIGAALAVLVLAIGFWKAALIGAFAAIGAVMGGVPGKRQWIRKLIDRLLPADE